MQLTNNQLTNNQVKTIEIVKAKKEISIDQVRAIVLPKADIWQDRDFKQEIYKICNKSEITDFEEETSRNLPGRFLRISIGEQLSYSPT